MTDAASVVVVGGGVAGLATVTALRAGGHVGPITLISREGLPYDRPMLSKDYLAGTRSAAQIELQPQEWFARNDIALLVGAEAAAVAAHETAVFLTDGRTIESEWIVLAAGGRAARPGIPGLDSARVHLLRARPDADRLRAALTPGARLLVVGGGLLGSEAAATATALGARVTLIDPLDPPHVSALGTSMAAWLHAQHAAHGVRVVTASLDALADEPGGIRAEWSDGGSASFDAVLVASGMTPETDLAERAGLEVDDGILVDGSLRTSQPRILAVGDCARVRGETRAEHWDAAQVAGNRSAATILGTSVAPSTAPWFWSDRYGRHVEVVGAMADPEGRHAGVVRGDPGPGHFSVWAVADGRVLGAASVDDPNAVRAARRLIDRGVEVDPDQLADPATDLRRLVRG